MHTYIYTNFTVLFVRLGVGNQKEY